MTKRTCQFPKHTCLREINFLKIAGISLLLFCTTSQIAVADSYEKNAVTATQQSKTEKITGKIVDESGEAIIGASVKVQGSTIGTITNMEGEFMIPNVPNKAVLLPKDMLFLHHRCYPVLQGRIPSSLYLSISYLPKHIHEVNLQQISL